MYKVTHDRNYGITTPISPQGLWISGTSIMRKYLEAVLIKNYTSVKALDDNFWRGKIGN